MDDYHASLVRYDTVIMGRKTYEFGYDHGLKPGSRAYDSMEHWIFSKSMDLLPDDGVHIVRDNWLEKIDELKSTDGSEIYLCGGAIFAGWLLQQGRIDRLKLKVNPVVFGNGIALFAAEEAALSQFDLTSVKKYVSGVVLLEYQKSDAG